MSDNKKYYYMKFKEDFFEQDHIKVIEAMPNGYIYSNILLKMYLRSLKFEGKLMITEKIPYDPGKPEILAKVLNHDISHFREALQISCELEIVKIMRSGAIFMTDIQNFIGHSTTEADRVRSYRKRIKTAARKKPIGKKTNVMTNVHKQKYKSTPERELELDIEIEKDKKKNSPVKKPSVKDNRFSFKEGCLCKNIQDSFEAVEGFTEYPIEIKAIKRIAGYIYKDSEKDGIDPGDFANDFLNCFYKIHNDKSNFLSDTPFKPSALSYNVYNRIKQNMKSIQKEMSADDKEALSWLLGKGKR